MKRLLSLIKYFNTTEIVLWSFSVIGIIVSYCIFDGSSIITLATSLIGVTSILLNAKGNPIGQALMIIFSMLYGYISFSFAYYGEMITYLGMTMPMAVFALISWLRHPYKGKKTEVAVNRLGKKEIYFMPVLSGIVTVVFYSLLLGLNTANIIPSTLSVTTSFTAVYLTFRRSPYFSLAYAFNDSVLLVLWTLASFQNIKYISVIVCFTAFLINDIYAFISWKRMEKRQDKEQNVIESY
jgi:nicotinamide mononucleotide transporter PnuC